MIKHNSNIKYNLILGSRRTSNYLWAGFNFLGGIGFFITGVSTYFHTQLFYLKNNAIEFIPQGITMTFYGIIGLLLGIFLFLNTQFDVGGGYNKYDKNVQKIEIFRIGSPIQTTEIYLLYDFKDISCIKLSIKEGINPRHEIYLCTKDARQIPLTRVGEPIMLSAIENEAIELASFLMVPLEEQ